MHRVATPRLMPHSPLQRIEVMKAAVWSGLSTTQQRYRRNFNINVRREKRFKIGNYIFLDRPILPVCFICCRWNGYCLIHQGSTQTVWTVQSNQRPTAYDFYPKNNIPSTVSIDSLTLSVTQKQMARSINHTNKRKMHDKRWYHCTGGVRHKLHNASCINYTKKKKCSEMIWIRPGRWYPVAATSYTYAFY